MCSIEHLFIWFPSNQTKIKPDGNQTRRKSNQTEIKPDRNQTRRKSGLISVWFDFCLVWFLSGLISVWFDFRLVWFPYVEITFLCQNEELRRSQRVCELTSETMHYMSHVYHNLSDLVIDWNQPPPRRLRASPVPAHQATAFIQQTIPVQVSVRTQTFSCLIIHFRYFIIWFLDWKIPAICVVHHCIFFILISFSYVHCRIEVQWLVS